ncbi:MAG: exodeoxyribonuclease III [Gammaproteobacteria bacterium]|nr:exodeoxyribonuclease III [Gammaproteobacteria bacterium]
MSIFKLATWNVNSIRVRLPHVLDWLTQVQPDVLCLQETKVTNEEFPHESLRAAGYHVTHLGQKAYNGVATLTRVAPAEVMESPPVLNDSHKRAVAVTVGGVRVINVYVPNGESVTSEKYVYKLAWYRALTSYLTAELQRYPQLAIVGDFNVAPEDRDVHDPERWRGQVLCSEPERAALQAVVGTGLVDIFRRFDQPEASYSWWDYRMGGFRRNLGLRIDHILCSPALADRCRACSIDKAPRALERPSDHAPVIAEFDL